MEDNELEEKKKSNVGLIVFLILIILGIAGYFCYDNFYTKSAKTSDSNKSDNIVFYENDKSISSYNCEGICEVYAFGEYPDSSMNEPIKQSNYKYVNTAIDKNFKNESKEERLIDLKTSDYVLIANCKEDICEEISTYVSSSFNANDNNNINNSGKVILFNVKTGKKVEISDIFSIELFDNKTFKLSSISKVIPIDEYNNEYEYNYTLVFNDGTSRKLENEFVNDWCWEAPCFALTLDENVVSKNSKGKYGLENIKTGKEVVEHRYEQISDVNNNYFAQSLEKYDGVYMLAKENGKTNLYQYNGSLKQITKEGYEAVYIINPTTLFVYKDSNFYFMDFNENLLSERININMKSFDQFPHEASVMFKKIDDNSLFIRISPDMYGTSDTNVNYYYKYDLKTKDFVKVSIDDVCPDKKEVDVCF